jgi:hypothetical protein
MVVVPHLAELRVEREVEMEEAPRVVRLQRGEEWGEEIGARGVVLLHREPVKEEATLHRQRGELGVEVKMEGERELVPH